ncbi:MAG: efflux RND transporter periplasmic adaptor subunit [Cellvibrionaceae bacterium]
MKTLMIILMSMVIGGGAVFVAMPYINTEVLSSNTASDEKKPLYWVAPMDANYRRDEPGKSPMGMDLVPVYEEDSGGNDAGPGTISIHPSVVNNLGVRTTTAEERPLQQTVTTVGYVQYDQESLIHIHPRVEGWIEKLYVKAAGNPVKQGQALYTLYAPQLVTAQEELLIALSRNNTQLITAAKDRLRALQLSERFIQQLSKTRKVKQTVTFYAPQSGVVDMLSIREGFFVKPSTTMMSIGALDEVWVEAEIFERQAALIRVGLPVTMTLDYQPDQQWQGEVDYIYPTLDAKTRTLRLRLRFDNRDKQLKPNMFARIQIDTQSEDPVLVIPSEALIRTGEQDRVVLSLGEGQFKSIAVTVGLYGDQWTEIIEGIEVGERIVTSAQFLLDSESSKTSDFIRMEAQQQANSVWAVARVVEVMAESGQLKLNHDPIPEWEWPTMTMLFSVDEGVNEGIDLSSIAIGQTLHIEINKQGDSDFSISQIHIVDPDKSSSMDQSNHSEMNHGDHSTMDHSNHSEMNHSDHSTMDHSNHSEMNHSDHSTMDHSQHTMPDQSDSKPVDHSKMQHH